MKWYLNELEDTTSISEIVDYQAHLKNVVDLIAIEPTKVTGELIKDVNQVIARLKIETRLTQACAITLKPVQYPLSFETEIIFGDNDNADYCLTNPIELTDIIFGYICIEKPYVVYHKDARPEEQEEERTPHPAFADLNNKHYRR